MFLNSSSTLCWISLVYQKTSTVRIGETVLFSFHILSRVLRFIDLLIYTEAIMIVTPIPYFCQRIRMNAVLGTCMVQISFIHSKGKSKLTSINQHIKLIFRKDMTSPLICYFLILFLKYIIKFYHIYFKFYYLWSSLSVLNMEQN